MGMSSCPITVLIVIGLLSFTHLQNSSPKIRIALYERMTRFNLAFM